MSDYQLPEVWEAPSQMGGAWGGLNQPTAGARFEQSLPKGDQPFQLYTLPTPNGIKATIMLEELKELGVDAGYDAYRIKIGDGDQFGSDFVAINPNSKIPAMLDQSGDQAIRVFESANILLYLAEKFGKLIPTDPAKRTEVLNWLFWQTGAAPFLGGGFGHFFHYAPEKIEYAINRFAMEAKRQLDLLDKELATKPYIAGGGLYHCGYRHLVLVWPSRPRQGLGPSRNFPKCEGIQAFASLDRKNCYSPSSATWLGSGL